MILAPVVAQDDEAPQVAGADIGINDAARSGGANLVALAGGDDDAVRLVAAAPLEAANHASAQGPGEPGPLAVRLAVRRFLLLTRCGRAALFSLREDFRTCLAEALRRGGAAQRGRRSGGLALTLFRMRRVALAPGMKSRWPISRRSGLSMPFRTAICSTSTPYARPMRQRFSPRFTVWRTPPVSRLLFGVGSGGATSAQPVSRQSNRTQPLRRTARHLRDPDAGEAFNMADPCRPS